MDFNCAVKLKTGDIIKNCFGDKLIVYKIDYNMNFSNNQKNCYIQVIDSKIHKRWVSYEDVYLQNVEESDQEAAFITWANVNKDYVMEHYDYLDIIRKAFKDGFSVGFEHSKTLKDNNNE